MRRGILALLLLFLPIAAAKASFLHTPESAQFAYGRIYVSNVGNLPANAKDADGFIATLSLSGRPIKVITKGLNAPKGIAVVGKRLFVADIDTVVVIDAETGKILARIRIPSAVFLNDVAYDGKRFVYVSDTFGNVIYRICAKEYWLSVFTRGKELGQPNGLMFKDGKLWEVGWKSGDVNIIYPNGKVVRYVHIGGNLDGITSDSKGDIFVSDFTGGKIYLIKNKKAKIFMKGLTSPADISSFDGKLLIPEFFANRVLIVKIGKEQ